MLPEPTPRRAESGQVLVIVALGMLAFIAMVGLVIDGGHAWGQQRITQNASDAAAEAGTVVMAQNMPYIAAGAPEPYSDADVDAAIDASAATNEILVVEAEYVRFNGTPIGVDVGTLGTAPPPTDADGVRVLGSRKFDTFITSIIGFADMTATTDATAVTGVVSGMPGNNVLPVTFPVTVPGCDGSGNLLPGTEEWVNGGTYTVMLCKNGPGNVGWLDWYPQPGDEPPGDECNGQGANELACSIENPNNPPMDIPEWYFVSQTGNTNASGVDAALEGWIGETVFFPLFDATCDVDPPDTSNFCPGGGGDGQNQWYHFPAWTAFRIDSVHIAQGNSACGPGLNGGVGCIKGTFVEMLGPGVLGEATGDETGIEVFGVNLRE